jgi:hypothetical protein
MLSNERTRASITLTVFFLSLLASIALASTALAASPCDNAIALDPNTVNFSVNLSVNLSVDETVGLRVQVPSTGVLTVELSRFARIDVASDPCGEVSADVLVVERSARHLVLAARTPGVLFLRLFTPTVDKDIRRVEVAADFTLARLVVEDFDLDGMPVRQTRFLALDPFTKGEPEEVEPDPDGLTASGGRLLAAFLTMEISLTSGS